MDESLIKGALATYRAWSRVADAVGIGKTAERRAWEAHLRLYERLSEAERREFDARVLAQ